MTGKERAQLRYLAALKAAGFRSWKRANERRCDLILNREHPAELQRLQDLAGLFLEYKFYEQNREQERMLRNLHKQLGTI